MAKKILLQYRGKTPRPFNVHGVSGVFHPNGPALPFSEEVAIKIRAIFPECVVVGDQAVKDIIPATEESETDAMLDGDLSSDGPADEAGPAKPKFPMELREGEPLPDGTWKAKDVRDWLGTYNLIPKQNLSKSKLLSLADRVING